MTVITMDNANWGETRAAAKLARRNRRKGLVALAAAIVGGGIPFGAGFVDGLMGREIFGNPDPRWTLALMLSVLALAALMAVRTWRELDEFEQRDRLVRMAAAGVTGVLVLPILSTAKPVIGIEDVGGTTWLLMVVALLTTMYLQRRRSRG